MKNINSILSFLAVLLVGFQCHGQIYFSQKEIKEDLQTLRERLIEAHYNIYTYITEDAFNRNFDLVYSSISKDSLTLLESTSLLQSVISKVNNGHTEIPFPAQSYGEYAMNRGTLFPLELAFENGRALIRKNWSSNQKIAVGMELISINGKSMEDILMKIYPLVSAERQYFKLAKIELYSFPRLFWQAFGEKEIFEIVVLENDTEVSYKVKAIQLIEEYEYKRREVINVDRTLYFLDDVAYLQPGSFGGNEVQYENFIDSCFQEIGLRQPVNLIIDLRNNSGGNDSYSDYLVSYIADKPFSWSGEFTLKTSAILKEFVRNNYDINQPFWSSVIENEDGSIYPYVFDLYEPQEKDKRYSGSVYVLINRQSHSQSAVTAAQFQDYNLATIVGEETGDFPSLLASQYNFTLPNTNVEVKIAKGYIVRVNGSKAAEGVIPDIQIRDHLLDDYDEILEGTLEYINSIKK